MSPLNKKSIYYTRVEQSVEFLNKWNCNNPTPDLAIVLGSGLSLSVPQYNKMKGIPFSEIPGFKVTNVPGHDGELRLGEITSTLTQKTRQIIFVNGRNHAYEGNNEAEVVHNIRTLIRWGVKGIILTNAAGSLNINMQPGKMMMICDHINDTGLSPIYGEYGADFGPRFVDMSDCYTKSWQDQFKTTAEKVNEEFYSGVYYGVLGPQYETAAEIKMMQNCGASAVGMSTVLEAIAAKQLNIKLAGISCLTNYGTGLSDKKLSHQDVVDMGQKFIVNMRNIVFNTAVELNI